MSPAPWTSGGTSGGTSARGPRELRAVAIIPARLASTRLPRKMLLAETGQTLFEHTARNVAASGVFARVVVATDAGEVAECARRAGIDVVLTRADHPSGTDRVDEAWAALCARGERADVVVGVQGDEPELDCGDFARLVRAFEDPAVELATLAIPFADVGAAGEPNTVKVVCDWHGDALYFSRALIPAQGHARLEAGVGGPRANAAEARPALLRRHVGVYAFTPDALARFCALPRGALEEAENLEQLRWLEAGSRIRVVEAARAPLGIDTRADYDRFVARWNARVAEERGTSAGGRSAGAASSASTGAGQRVRRERAQAG